MLSGARQHGLLAWVCTASCAPWRTGRLPAIALFHAYVVRVVPSAPGVAPPILLSVLTLQAGKAHGLR